MAALDPVQYFIALLWANGAPLADVEARLTSHWGALDFVGPDRPFECTHYYEDEMGPNLRRRLVSFEMLRSPGELAPAKHACIGIESAFKHTGGSARQVNLDVGYLDHNKMVLASVKAAGQKIYLADGIHADLVARYADGRYQPFPWTFPDFKDGRYDAELAELRARYLQKIKVWREAERT